MPGTYPRLLEPAKILGQLLILARLILKYFGERLEWGSGVRCDGEHWSEIWSRRRAVEDAEDDS